MASGQNSGEMFAKAALAENVRLFRWLYRFNCLLPRDVHPDHLAPDFPPAAFQQLLATSRGHRQANRYLCQRFDLAEHGFWDFARPRRRLALLEQSSWHRLTEFLGAAICHQQISRVIDRSVRQSMKEALGEEIYLFAVKRAPLQIRNVPAALLVPPGDNIAASVRQAGQRCLAVCLSGSPGELLKRLSLKLPPGQRLPAPPQLTSDEEEHTWKIVKRILLAEIEPDAASCFS